MHKDLSFEVFGKVQSKHLDSLSPAWPSDDIVSSLSVTDRHDPPNAVDAASLVDNALFHTSSSDMVASIQILELTSEGTYKPVPLVHITDSGGDDTRIFALRQGQQRRIVLELRHDTEPDANARLTTISDMVVNHVRSIDTDLLAADVVEGRDTSVRLTPQQQGASMVEAAWDSSLHESPLLNCATAPGRHVSLTLSWRACDMDFSTHLRVCIHARESPSLKAPSTGLKRSSSLFKFFSPANAPRQQANKVHVVFRAFLRPVVVKATDSLATQYHGDESVH